MQTFMKTTETFIKIVLMLAYFIPAVVAWKRQHRHCPAIVAFNLLLGWTILGWIGALIWALMDQRKISQS